ncbi:AraC family transcriptional regulator [Pedobacter sp. Hv1]|uniref:AraC family transcriptional regulator n=1 Tax=Pedobacter sp. Hv1 TaxID=1740090 RepID=UPI0006D8CE9A|nr:AraC family transcriptional regulator [Pedobacter sp. Hv1]KQC00821.1 hypothetical protein AQF98_09080 [Pedobacter sp. Hv1]
MKATIPEFSILEIVKPISTGKKAIDYYVAFCSAPMQLSKFPQRGAYYGIAICTQGSATLLANLEQYQLTPGTLIVMGPETIRSWPTQTADYVEEILFFTEPFFLAITKNPNSLHQFTFLDNNSPKTILLSTDQCDIISKLLKDIKQTIAQESPREPELVGSYINIVLNQVADLYELHYPDGLLNNTNIQRNMVLQFKKLLLANYLQLHTVNAYAALLNVTAKHLSQTIKANTGKTVSVWIQEILILEAKVRLKQTNLSINQIADVLNFSDASLFGKYFKRYAGCSPAAYRKN